MKPTFDGEVDLAFSLLWLFSWREIRSSDGDGSLRVLSDSLQSLFRRHLPPGRLKSRTELNTFLSVNYTTKI